MIEDYWDSIYQSCSGYGPGHLAWCPVPQLEEVPRILEAERAAPEEHIATHFRIVQLSSERDHFRERQKLPIKALSLASTEELLISKAKMRPCVTVSIPNSAFADPATTTEIRRRKHLQDDSLILAPLYGIASIDAPAGFGPVMVARIRALMYNQFFYLPNQSSSGGPALREDSIVRLDRLFATQPSRGCQPMDMKLADEPLGLLLEMVRVRFGGEQSNDLITLRELFMERLPEDLKQPVAPSGSL